MTTVIGFTSRPCKTSYHGDCSSKWDGLGFYVLCDCDCHKNKEALDLVEGPVANAKGKESSFRERTQNDYR